MEASLQFLLDRREIDDALTRYATAIDARDWTMLDTVFTEDARLDYRSAGGIRGPYPDVRQWLSEVLPIFTWTQHLVVNRAVEIDPAGKTARCQLDLSQSEPAARRRCPMVVRRGRPLPRPVRADRSRLADCRQGGGDAVVGASHAGASSPAVPDAR